MKTINIALVGAGVVGSSFVEQLDEKHQRIIDEFDIDLRVAKILVRNPETKRKVPQSSLLYSTNNKPGNFKDVLTTDMFDVNTEGIDIVVEVAGGVDDAYSIVTQALENSRSVVTANKALLASKGDELYDIAASKGVDLLFEAAVGGAIPFIRPLRESLAVEKITGVKGILNGTTNFILSQMTANGASYKDALAEAQSLGYAEADPSADVDGHDAAAKIAIVSLLATGAHASQGHVQTVGITGVSADDIKCAGELGFVIKLIALVQDKNEKEVFLRVEPTFVPKSHPFSNVHNGFNAVSVSGKHSGETMFIGAGAGGPQTASAVLGDVIDAAINISNGSKGARVGFAFDKTIADPREWKSSWYLSLDVDDKPGVLAQVTEVLGKRKVSVATMRQNGEKADKANVVFMTHECADGNIKDATSDLSSLACVERVASLMPIMR